MFKLRKEPVFTFGVYKNWGKTCCDNTENYPNSCREGEKKKSVLEVFMKIKWKDWFSFFLITSLLRSQQWATNST